jgi:DNA-directed RNA polymerase specialized sigma24 family protein
MAISELPERERDVVTWLFRLGWSIPRIADEMGTTTDAVSGLKARAIARLQRQLPPEDFTALMRKP